MFEEEVWIGLVNALCLTYDSSVTQPVTARHSPAQLRTCHKIRLSDMVSNLPLWCRDRYGHGRRLQAPGPAVPRGPGPMQAQANAARAARTSASRSGPSRRRAGPAWSVRGQTILVEWPG